MLLRKEAGSIVLDGHVVAPTLQCCHCNRHWQPQPGSGTTRGFCRNCMGPTCGSHGCDVCMPFEKKLDLYEKGKMLTL